MATRGKKLKFYKDTKTKLTLKTNTKVEDVTRPYSKVETKKVPFPLTTVRFSINRGNKSSEYNIETGFGYYVRQFRKASNLRKVAETVEAGLPVKELEPMFRFLEFKVKDIAKAASISTRTVSRWKQDTIIADQSLTNFFKIDELIRKGVDLFGNEDEFKKWLSIPNLALGNITPGELITSPLGVEMIEDALEALEYGTVM